MGEQLDERGRRVLVPVESEQAVIAKMVALRKEGLTFTQVVQRLNEEQVPARRGGVWRKSRSSCAEPHAATVRRQPDGRQSYAQKACSCARLAFG